MGAAPILGAKESGGDRWRVGVSDEGGVFGPCAHVHNALARAYTAAALATCVFGLYVPSSSSLSEKAFGHGFR